LEKVVKKRKPASGGSGDIDGRAGDIDDLGGESLAQSKDEGFSVVLIILAY
jgi:hypothetical protein